MKAQNNGIKHILKAFMYSYAGFISAFKSETAFRQDLLFCGCCGIALFFLSVNGVGLALMVFSLILILLMELVNTALEFVVDRIGTEYHELSKKAKDIGSSLVFLSFVNMFLIWGIILFNLLKQ